MTPAAPAMAVHNLDRSAAILETDAATQAAPGGHNGGFGTHVQPPWRSACVQFIGVALPVSTFALQTAYDEKQSPVLHTSALANGAASRQRVRVLLGVAHLANPPEPRPW